LGTLFLSTQQQRGFKIYWQEASWSNNIGTRLSFGLGRPDVFSSSQLHQMERRGALSPFQLHRLMGLLCQSQGKVSEMSDKGENLQTGFPSSI
jgi:hypothetical protein